jgi:hypothetical protein
MITGTMPKWRRYFHRIAGGFMGLFFIGFGLLGARNLFGAAGRVPTRGLVIASLLFIAWAAFLIGLNLWFGRRIITEFAFDGQWFSFRTLGASEMQRRGLPEIADVRDWRGRGQYLGYVLVFRLRGKAYLEYTVSNCAAVAEQLRSKLL